jgi:hypothetical protein
LPIDEVTALTSQLLITTTTATLFIFFILSSVVTTSGTPLLFHVHFARLASTAASTFLLLLRVSLAVHASVLV